MKRFRYLLPLICLLALTTSCHKRSNYTNTIPADAAAVMRIDLETLLRKGNLMDATTNTLSERVQTALTGGPNAATPQKIKDLAKDPSECGIDLKAPAWWFTDSDGRIAALTLKISQHKKFKALIDDLGKEAIVAQVQKIKHYRYAQMGQFDLAWDNGTLLIVLPTTGNDNERVMHFIEEAMQHSEKEAFDVTQSPFDAEAEKHDASFLIKGTLLSAEVRSGTLKLPADVNPSTLCYAGHFDFLEGNLHLEFRSLTTDPHTLDYLATLQKPFHPIDHGQLGLFQDNTPCWIGTHIDGNALYQLLNTYPSVRESFRSGGQFVNIEQLFSSIRGDVSAAYGRTFLVYAQLTDDRLMRAVSRMRYFLPFAGSGVGLRSFGDHGYHFSMPGTDLWFGSERERLYLTNSESMASNAQRMYALSLAKAPWASEVKGNRLFVSLAPQMLNYFLRSAGIDGTVANALTSTTAYATIALPDLASGHIHIQGHDPNQNILATWIQALLPR